MKTNKTHFELFKNECQKWEERLRLDGWSILYGHEKISGGALANGEINLTNRTVYIKLNIDWEDEPINNQAIKDSAKHELIHILLARLASNGKYRFVTDFEMKEAEEELVYKLEKIIQ